VKRIAPVIAIVVLLLPAAALAKGTNVRTSSAPNGTDAGEQWVTTAIITMPGNGRFDGLSPRMIISKDSVRQSFRAEPTGKRSVYRFRVVFPTRGVWRYGVADGFDRFEPGAGRVHWFPEVRIAADQPKLAKPPRPVSGDIRFEMQGEPRGQLPPETVVALPSDEEDDDGSGAMFPALAFVLAAAVVGPVWLRRHRKNKRAA
jgi:hypothetical protein